VKDVFAIRISQDLVYVDEPEAFLNDSSAILFFMITKGLDLENAG
jgi:hypothetical protein